MRENLFQPAWSRLPDRSTTVQERYCSIVALIRSDDSHVSNLCSRAARSSSLVSLYDNDNDRIDSIFLAVNLADMRKCPACATCARSSQFEFSLANWFGGAAMREFVFPTKSSKRQAARV